MVKEQFESVGNLAVPKDGLSGVIHQTGGGQYFLKALESKADADALYAVMARKTNKEDSEN